MGKANTKSEMHVDADKGKGRAETEYYSKCEARFSNRTYHKQEETTL